MPKITTKPIVCINGSRNIQELNISSYINPSYPAAVVAGGARGVDTIAKKWANSHHIEYVEYKANWDVHGKSAGMIRNHEMVDFTDELVSFWDGLSSGTKEAIDYAVKLNKPVTIHLIESLD